MRTALVAILSAFALGLASCATPGTGRGALPDLAPGERPAPASDEAGLWRLMDRLETNLKTSGAVVRDPALNDYLRGIVCKLAVDYCGDLRIYVVETPHFNASMAPNGTMQVWTGLLLRVQNEAQLAYVLGHEAGHYLRRHSVSQWRDLRSKSDALVFFRILTSAAGAGFVGDLAQLVALGTVFAFSRDQEREADDIGFALMTKAGYDGREAAKVWEALIEEQEAADKPRPSFFFTTHPASKERIATLEELAGKLDAGGARGRDSFLEITLPLRARLLRDELTKREFGETRVVLDHLLEAGSNPGEIHFFRGELYRLRGEEWDDSRALAAYDDALRTGDAPPETYRSRGLVYMRVDEPARARAAFRDYLAARPDASDRRMIESYLATLE